MVECELKKEQYKVSEVQILVSLQTLLNKTAERLCEALAVDWNSECLLNLKLLVTTGFDSSSAHLNPHQKCTDPLNECSNAQNSLFISNFIVLQIKSTSVECTWLNPTPQSVRYCRPLRIAIEKEDDTAILREYERLSKEISDLVHHRFNMPNGNPVTVQFNVSKTMFDGKCVNTIVSNKATCRCPMCNRTAHCFGNLDDDFTPNVAFLERGLGLLHCEIKSFEHLLHLAYRNTVELRKWDNTKELKGMQIMLNVQITFY